MKSIKLIFPAIVYMIDSRHLSDLSDVRDDLHVLMEDRDLKHLPVLLVLGKKDLSGNGEAFLKIQISVQKQIFML